MQYVVNARASFLAIFKRTNVPLNKLEICPSGFANDGAYLIKIVLSIAVAKLSKPTTFWLSFNKVSSRFDPMKPATPVIIQLACFDFRVS